jgi:beta-mannosidase
MDLRLDGNNWELTHLVPSEWAWRQVWKEDWDPLQSPAAFSWIRGTVPGDVIADAIDARLVHNPYTDMHSREAEWTSERDWIYRKRFSVPAEMQGKTVLLHFDGVDSTCHVYLNGELLGKHEGMFLPFEYDVTRLLRFAGTNTLVVVVEHMPPVEAVQGQIGWSSQARVWKSRFAYAWDWCTRLVPVGIWQSVRLTAVSTARIEDVWVRTQVYSTTANVEVQVQLGAATAQTGSTRVRLRMMNPMSHAVADPQEVDVQLSAGKGDHLFRLDINNPELWWPNNMGAQPLYMVCVDVLNASGESDDARELSVGLRTIRAVPNEGAAPDALPYTIEVNGRKMFVKGWNWAPIDNLYGRVQPERYERLLTLARHAHCNLLRVWGGGMLERKAFYDLCDRFGILVWQEFHQSSSGIDNRPPDDEAYLAYIDQQARQIIPQRRNHPSLALWCGGNELMERDGIPLTDAHPALARLKAIVQEIDPGRLWLPTSSTGPVFSADPKLLNTGQMHDVHGPWQYQGPEAQYQFYNNIDPLYHSEFGAEGAANLYTLRRFISPVYEWPPDATNPAWVHHGSWWMHREKLEAMFGPLGDIETFVRASQWMQAEGLRYAIESNRRRKWHCSGTSPWQLNEAFPNTACTNSVDFVGLTKPVYWWVRRAYEPVHLSAKYERITWKPGETWRAELWVNNSRGDLPGCKWMAEVMDLAGASLLSTAGTFDLPDNGSARLGELSLALPQDAGIFVLLLSLYDSQGTLLSRNDYQFTSAETGFQPMLNAPQTTLNVWHRRSEVRVRNTGHSPALFVQIEPDSGQQLLPQDNYFCLAPGEVRSLQLVGHGPVTISTWNARAHNLRLS